MFICLIFQINIISNFFRKFLTRWVGNVEVPNNIKMFVGFWQRAKFAECLNLHIPRAGAKVSGYDSKNFSTGFNEA